MKLNHCYWIVKRSIEFGFLSITSWNYLDSSHEKNRNKRLPTSV